MTSQSKFNLDVVAESFNAAWPVMLGYVASGIPCGILCASAGMNWIQVLIFSVFFYSGAGQFMIPNMFIAGANLASIIGSVSFVNTRQILYSAALAPKCKGVSKKKLFWYMATVTDETFGISITRFGWGNWSVENAILLNEFSHFSWVFACVLGVLIGSLVNIPLEIASFAMTCMFIYLLSTAFDARPTYVAASLSIVFVIVFKNLGIGSASVFFSAIMGVLFGYISTSRQKKRK